MGSHGEDHNPQWFLYSLSTAKALLRFDSNSIAFPMNQILLSCGNALVIDDVVNFIFLFCSNKF